MNPYQHMADRINRLEPGQALCISAQEIRDLPGLPDWAFMANITTGFERVKESVIGSAHSDIWQFSVNEFTGDVTCYRFG